MYDEIKQTILKLIRVSDQKAITVNRVFRRLIGKHKADIKHAMKLLINEGKLIMIVAKGEAARILNVQPGTEVYILNK